MPEDRAEYNVTPRQPEPLTEEQAEVIEGVPQRFKWAFEKAYDGTASPRQCIRAACLRCRKFDQAAISDCEERTCPLWRVRPYSSAPEWVARRRKER